jgi:Ca-activated chloride channel family protein
MTRIGLVLALGAALLLPSLAHADAGAQQPSAPQGVLHLRSHTVSVTINNGFATTRVDQVLVNPKLAPVEAAWAFPLPKEAAISELSVQVGEERRIGEVVAKKKARTIYETERDGGRDAALAEQNKFYDYRISLARVPARGEVEVTLVYYQPLEIESGVGRYLYPLTEGNTQERMNTSFWTMERKVSGHLTFDVAMKTSFPLDALHSPSHPALKVAQKDEATWTAHLELPHAHLARDFVLLYRLTKDLPARVELLAHRTQGAGEGTFMAVVTPGSSLEPITEGRDWIFVLDISGSMKGEKIRMLRTGVAEALRGLEEKDRVRIFQFNNGCSEVTRGWTPVTQKSQGQLAAQLGTLQANGGTNIFGALDQAYRTLDDDRTCAVILVSDGVANVGPSHYRDFIQQANKNDVRLFTFIMGNSANTRLLGDLATVSGGFAKSVSVHDEIGAHLLLARDRMSHQAIHGVTFELEGATAVHPKRLPSLYVGQQLVVFGRYDKTGAAKLAVKAKISGKTHTWSVPVELPAADDRNPEIERLYAMNAIADMEREMWLDEQNGAEVESAVTDLAVRYSLVTDYTSMIIVNDDRKQHYGLGDANARRRARESRAAQQRTQQGNRVQVQTGSQPIAGGRAAHAPSRNSGDGVGALGPFWLLPLAGLALVARRRKRTQPR